MRVALFHIQYLHMLREFQGSGRARRHPLPLHQAERGHGAAFEKLAGGGLACLADAHVQLDLGLGAGGADGSPGAVLKLEVLGVAGWEVDPLDRAVRRARARQIVPDGQYLQPATSAAG